MNTLERLRADHDPKEIQPHPTQPGFTIQCRNCGVMAEGNVAEFAADYAQTIWFCGLPDCQAAYALRVTPDDGNQKADTPP